MIYLLEDNESIRRFVIYALNNSGFEAEGFEYPSEFYKAIEKAVPELVLLDRMLPEEDGMTVLKKLRKSQDTAELPIIMLTALDSEADKVEGLDNGADDYISKPFGTMELISRVKALLRRSGSHSPEKLCIGQLTISPSKHEVFVKEQPVQLTLKEYDMLLYLIKHKGEVISRDELLRKIWGYDFTGESRTVDVHIRTLRSKLSSCGDIIKTIRGVGYKAGESTDDQ